MRLNLHLIFVLLLAVCSTLSAQEKEKVKDSAAVYKKIEEFSKKRGFTKFLHGLIFEPVSQKRTVARTKQVPKKTFNRYEGKIIRKINVETLDPFGFSELDTISAPSNRLSRIGNRLHLKTKRLTVLNLLLFKRNKPFDSLLVQESERLIRSQRYVRAVHITPVVVRGTDSVDVEIRVLDAWSLTPDIAGSTKAAYIELTERNFFGLGHQVEVGYRAKFSGDNGFNTRYIIPNIMNTYIRTELEYKIDLDGDYRKGVKIERPFFSPFTRWAGGVYVGQLFRSDTLPDAEGVFAKQHFKSNIQDYWSGYSIQLFAGSSEDDRTTNLITTVRYLDVNYTESPTAVYDSINFYSDEKFYLAGVGISSRQFVEDKYIFNYGVVEDVPVGRTFGLTGGWQDKNQRRRAYAGARLSMGKYYKWGYFSFNTEYGTFFNNNSTEQSALSVQLNYFTNLLESSRWKFRQFVKTRMVLGQNRQPSMGDELTLNDANGIQGFDPIMLYGTKKFTMTFQSQAYSPWNLAGFRLNPYLSYSMGLLTGSGNTFKDSRLYSQIAAGFIISNDYLVFSTFQLSVAFYPTIPGRGENIFKTNGFHTEDFGFHTFELNKPEVVDYR